MKKNSCLCGVILLLIVLQNSCPVVFAQEETQPPASRKNIVKQILEKLQKRKDAVEEELVKFSGYYKNIAVASKTTSSREDFYFFTERLRLQTDVKFTDKLSANLTYDNELILNDFSGTSDFATVRQKNQKNLAFMDTDKTISDRKHTYWKHYLHRAYVKYTSPLLQCTLGKQAIDWSRMKFYYPFDLFNPVSPLDLEQDEKIGADALNLEYFPDSFSSINLVYAPHENSGRTSAGIKASRKIKDYDISIMAAESKKDEVFGAGFDGYLKEAGFRGEITYTKKDNRREFLRSCIGMDHNLTPKLYGLAEYFYNGGAESDAGNFLNSYEFSRQAITMKKHIFGTGLEYELSGITKLANYLYYDFKGKSIFLNPEFRYNILANLDFSLGLQAFFGGENSEFGSYQEAYYARLKYFF